MIIIFFSFFIYFLIESSDLQQGKIRSCRSNNNTNNNNNCKNGKGRINSKESLLLTEANSMKGRNINIRSLLWNDYWKVLWRSKEKNVAIERKLWIINATKLIYISFPCFFFVVVVIKFYYNGNCIFLFFLLIF